MKGLWKKALSLALSAVMCVGLLPVTAMAAPTSEIEFKVSEMNGNAFDMNIIATDADGLDTLEFVLVFDNTVVELDGEYLTSSKFDTKMHQETTIGNKTGADCILMNFAGSFVPDGEEIGNIGFLLKDGKTTDDFNKTTFSLAVKNSDFAKAFNSGYDTIRVCNTANSSVKEGVNDIAYSFDYPNDNAGIRLAAPGITATPNDGITSGGIDVTITPTPDADYARGYLLTLKDSDGNEVWKREVTDLRHGFWDPTVVTGKTYTASVQALAKAGTDFADSAVVTSAPVVATAKPKLATPSITLEPHRVSSWGGFEFEITPITDTTKSIDYYKVVIYDSNGVVVCTKERDYNEYMNDAYIRVSDGVIEGEKYTATVQAIAKFNGQMTDSPVSAETAPTEAAYKALILNPDNIDNLTVNDEITINLAEKVSYGKAPYTYAVTSGTLPDGLTLDTATGVISGKLTTATTKTTDVYVTVTDSQSTPDVDTAKITFYAIAKDQGEIQVTNKNITMEYGDTIDLKSYLSVVEKIQPLANTKYKFEVTEGDDIVTVDDNGNVTALKADADTTVKVTATVVSDDTYKVADPVTFTITVNRKVINIIPEAGQTKVYGKPDPTPFKFTIDPATPLVEGDTLGDDILTRGGTDDVGEKEFVVKADVVNSFMDKYLITLVEDSPKFTITPAKGVVVEGDGETAEFTIAKEYGAANFNLGEYGIQTMALQDRSFTYALKEGSAADVIEVTSAGNVSILNAGTATVVVTAEDDNYTDKDGNKEIKQEITITVEPKAVTVTAEDKTMVYEGTEPVLTYKIDPATLENGTKVADELDITLSREAGDVAGTYAINVAVDNNPNYTVTVEPGTFTIDRAPGQIEGTVTEDPIKIIYG
ncbi:MBG domain-containing protein, partial [Anaerotignum sp.]